MSKSFRIEMSSLDHNLRNFNPRARRAIQATLDYQKPKSETRMRTEAPWTDRTTNARNGLFAAVIQETENDWLFVVSHSVSYGIWLEVMNSGEYAIVRPEFLKAQREIMKRLSRLFERMEKGRK